MKALVACARSEGGPGLNLPEQRGGRSTFGTARNHERNKYTYILVNKLSHNKTD